MTTRRAKGQWGLLAQLLSLLCALLVTAAHASQQNVPSSTRAQELYKVRMDLVRQSRWDEAVSSFEQGLSQEPKSLLLLNALGATTSSTPIFQEGEGVMLSKAIRSSEVSSIWGAQRDIIEHYKLICLTQQLVDSHLASNCVKGL